MPLPPMPSTAEVRMSSPDKSVRSGVRARMRVICASDAGGFLHRDDVLEFGQALQCGRLDVDSGAAGHAVNNDRES